ncbi:S-layer homology domain-containing protein [Alkalihalophilus marmarensis]|uniref:S-layer homology domain-containing protein n=1 Tax=Alkalihalophilus marmarensis TaxID=521377 RepID=UPI002040B2B1|nr:S-layer homology domain-containing protein [Alkalihalophilus marmarensis]MCM3489891.1 S-layer homology domain-containing protein [Alkalihalophilus marmarensis]
MAYQPKSYRKFLATSVAAAMVATVATPAAFAEQKQFSDLTESHWAYENIMYLVEKGAMQGDLGKDTVRPNDNINRAEAAVIIAKTLDLDVDLDVTTDAFRDVPATHWANPYIAAVQAQKPGVLNGYNGMYRPGDTITRQEMASITYNAYKEELELVEGVEIPFTDTENLTWGKEFIEVLYSNGIIAGATNKTFNPTGNVTRAQAAAFVHRTEVEDEREPRDVIVDPIDEELAVESVSAINARTLEVKFNQAVDTQVAKLEVVKSTIKQNVSNTTWASDNQSVTIELSSKLTQGEYTVNVTGVSEETLTKSVDVENEKVDSIEILSDVAVVDNTNNPTTATVAYQVKNQYGEDITKTTTLTTNDVNNVEASPATGVVTLKNFNTGTKVGDKLPVTLVHAESAKSATKVVTLSAASAVTDVAVTGIYNKDGKALNEDSNLTTDAFYLLVDVKDQYGNPITGATAAAAGLIKSETNPTVISAAGTGNAVTLTELTIDGKKQLGLRLNAPGTGLKAGESQLTLISTTSGKNATYKINVAETTRTDVVNLSAPALAVANEDILVPVSVLDKEGKEVTDLKVLNDAQKGVKVTFGASSVSNPFVKAADGNVYIKVSSSNEGVLPLVAQSSTFKVATSTIKVEKAAVPTTIRGLKNPLALATTNTKTITVADLVIEDQYGRDMKSADVSAYLSANNKGILIEKANPSATVVTLPSTLADQTIKHNAGVTVTAGSANGSETLRFLLADADGTNSIAASTAEATVRVTDGTEYASYELVSIGKVQAADIQSAGPKSFTVNGVLNGSKVALVQGADFTASISGGKTTGVATVANGEITVEADRLNTNTDREQIDTEFTLRVTINATGEVIEQKFIVSPADKKVADFFFTSAAPTSNYDLAKGITEATVESGSTVADLETTDSTPLVVNVATVDQYGNKDVRAISADTVTIVPERVADVTITHNGTANAEVALRSGVTESTVTFKVTIGGATKDIKVKVTQ